MPESAGGPDVGTIPLGGVRGLLEEVKRRILAHPYDQNDFCGTACCIAGQIDCVLNGEMVHNARGGKIDAVDTIEKLALEALGEKHTTWLFGCINAEEDEDDYGYEADDANWPPDLSIEYEDATTPEYRALVGCKAIDRYLEQRGL